MVEPWADRLIIESSRRLVELWPTVPCPLAAAGGAPATVIEAQVLALQVEHLGPAPPGENQGEDDGSVK